MRYFILLTACLIVGCIYAQTNEWTFYRSFDNVTCQVQQGDYIWLGTNEYLVKYNRLTGETEFYDTYNNSQIAQMKMDSQGRLWITASIGYFWDFLCCFEDGVWTDYSSLNPISDIVGFCIDINDNIWLGNYGSLIKFDGSTWTSYSFSDLGLSDPANFDRLCSDIYGNIWFCPQPYYPTHGIIKFNGTTSTVYNTDNSGLASNEIRRLFSDQLGRVWIFSNSTCSVFNNGNWASFNLGIETLIGYPNCMACDNQGNSWFGLECSNIVSYNGTSFNTYNESNSNLIDSPVLSISVDLDGKPWASFSSGFYKLNNDNVWVQLNQGIPSGSVSCIAIDSNDCKWFVSDNGGLTRFNNGVFESVSTGGLPSGDINNLAFDNNGILWVTTRALTSMGYTYFTLSSYSDNVWTNYSLDGNNAGPASCLVIDDQNNKWVGSISGLYKFNGGSSILYTRENSGIPCDDITCVGVDNLSRIWVGGWDGVYDFGGYSMFDGVNWFEHPRNSAVLSIATDDIGNIWIACQDSLLHIVGNNINSLNIGYLNRMLIDNDGILWMFGTNWSIIYLLCYNNGIFTHLDGENSGLQYRPLCIAVDSDNNKWIGAEMGLYKYTGNGTHNQEYHESVPPACVSSYPNPFHETATIAYELKTTEQVKISIYDVKGRIVMSYDRLQAPGKHTFVWDGTNNSKQSVASGIYFCIIRTANTLQTCKLVHLN